MPIRITLTPLSIIIQPIRPDMPAATINLCTGPIPRLQQPRRRRPVIRRAPRGKRLCLADAQRVRHLVQRRALVHVGPVGAEADVAVEVAVGRGHAGDVLAVMDLLGRVVSRL